MPGSTSGSQYLDSLSCHVDDMNEVRGDDDLEEMNDTPGIHIDEAIREPIACEPESRSSSNSDLRTSLNTLQSVHNMELPILRKTNASYLKVDDSDSSELSELCMADHPSLVLVNSAVDKIEVAPLSLSKPVKKRRQPVYSPYFAKQLAPTSSRCKKSIETQRESEASIKNPFNSSKSTNSSPEKKSTNKKQPPGMISCIPFPPLSAPHFGLIQEKLAHDPFRLLIAVTFLNRTHGKQAIPVFYELMDKYPTPQAILDAPKEDIVDVIRHLGLQNQRAATYQSYARIFLEDPPTKHKRYKVADYPNKGDGRNVGREEILPEEEDDERAGWEIGHLTKGAYAIDSWRIFCRDVLLGRARGWNGDGRDAGGMVFDGTVGDGNGVFQPEWMRVLPKDKELRAFLRWMWLKEGFEWDPETGEKEVAGREVLRWAMEGGLGWDEGFGEG